MSQENSWNEFYKNSAVAYPAEGVIRILKGEYPNQSMPRPVSEDTIIDIGCGDGRHFGLFESLGLDYYGTEITDAICDTISHNTKTPRNRLMTARFSTLSTLGDDYDYVLAWNSIYYMDDGDFNFNRHVKNTQSIIRDDGWLICSVPQPSCFIFKNCEPYLNDHFVKITNDYFGIRNGTMMRYFRSQECLESAFAGMFHKFSHAAIDIEWFGLRYSWWVFTAQKKPFPD
jgi:SAM-dependent methyltransferase